MSSLHGNTHVSIQSHIRDREVIRLYSHRRYLGIDKKGRIVQSHNPENSECKFCVSLHSELWLCKMSCFGS